MLEIKNAVKHFGAIKAIDDLSCKIENGSIFGIVGSNGAGKSTLLRIISGVYRLDKGQMLLDGQEVYDNPSAKKDILFLSDSPAVEFGMTLKALIKEYKNYYKDLDINEYKSLLKTFDLDENSPLSTFSKGMVRQAMIILALCSRTKYIVLDETLDGLDPMIRSLVKKKIYQKVIDTNTTVIVSSHSLRELEDFCDSLALIHKGKLIFEQQLQDENTAIVKVQAAFKDDSADSLSDIVDVVKAVKSGTVFNLLVRGKKEEIIEKIQKLNPVLLEVVPLSLEEIFTYELQTRNYAIDPEEQDVLSLEDKINE